MNSDMEIQREAIVEVVGTQYDGRSLNHQPVLLRKNLRLKHQKDNLHDSNAVLVLTDDGRELGFLPKGYASIYAPAIDSGRYVFVLEVVKSEQDSERPILIVKITSELKNHSEEDIERNITALVQNIVNSCVQLKTEYLRFIYADTVNTEKLLLTLNSIRLAERLCYASADMIDSHGIEKTPEIPAPLTKDMLIKNLNELKADVSDILKKIQKSYNDSIDIDDEEEYHRVQSKIRESRRKFRLYDSVLASMLETVRNYVDIELQAEQSAKSDPEQKKETVTAVLSEPQNDSVSKCSQLTEQAGQTTKPEQREKTVTAVLPKPQNDSLPNLTEQAFFDWLVTEDGLSESTAGQYISNIHSIEKLYRTIFGVRRNIFGADSSESVKSVIESLIVRSEYINANEQRHNSFNASLKKFAQFAGISVSGFENTQRKKNYQKRNYQSYDRTKSSAVKTVDFNNPQDYTYCRPCSFILNEVEHPVRTWKELYTEFLILLYNDIEYAQILKNLTGKSLYNRLDFADKTSKYQLREPIRVSVNFFAEGNLSAKDIVRRIKCLKKLCSIGDEDMIIEYYAFEKDGENFSQDIADETAVESIPEKAENNAPTPERFTPDTAEVYNPKQSYSENVPEQAENNAPTPERFTPDTAYTSNPKQSYSENVPEQAENNAPATKRFIPNTTGEFNLKNALIEIFLSDAPEITKYREYKGGISSKNLRKLIEKYYKKPVELFEFSKILMLDKTFRSVNKGCYVLNKALVTQKKEKVIPKKITPVETVNENKKLTIEPIMEVIRENRDNLQYEYGFGAYEVKSLLRQKGFKDVSEKEIETLMVECPELREVEEGYYLPAEKKPVESFTVTDDISKAGNITLKLNGKLVTAYDYSDALNKICEFAINCKPFRMARIECQDIKLHGNSVFYRNPVPVDGCNRLSDGLQVISVGTLSDLQEIVFQLKKYCQIDNDMIKLLADKEIDNG